MLFCINSMNIQNISVPKLYNSWVSDGRIGVARIFSGGTLFQKIFKKFCKKFGKNFQKIAKNFPKFLKKFLKKIAKMDF